MVDGYIKTTAVEIDYDSLKRKKTSLGALSSRPVEDDQEVYDDVAEQENVSRYVKCKLYSKSNSLFVRDCVFLRCQNFTFHILTALYH